MSAKRKKPKSKPASVRKKPGNAPKATSGKSAGKSQPAVATGTKVDLTAFLAVRQSKGPGEWQPMFLATLSVCGIVSWAAKEAGISRVTAYEHRKADEVFAAAWKDAVESAVDGLEFEARRRAVDGTLKPVYQGGKKVGAVREYSDTLLIFLLKAANPTKYRDNAKIVISGDPNNPVKHQHSGTVTSRIEQLSAAFVNAAAREEENGTTDEAALETSSATADETATWPSNRE